MTVSYRGVFGRLLAGRVRRVEPEKSAFRKLRGLSGRGEKFTRASRRCTGGIRLENSGVADKPSELIHSHRFCFDGGSLLAIKIWARCDAVLLSNAT
jgi:hypothetical protein